MSNILYDMFLERYHPRDDVAWDTEESDALFEELEELELEMDRRMGREHRRLLIRYAQVQCGLRNLAYAAYFAEGFRLCAKLYPGQDKTGAAQ